ncbi:carbohydrate-binding protein [Streptomyces sp. BHT-5-2]|uniref:carbohydrate-binding protein n=1 Tax=Streptomyces sp. BHT-5-2 TaxID=2866715 RepID=UPI001C8E8892|nr:carbohydrate-binding protein [Streptomyces sp. BHT-5-2]QZL04010.1 carbohydrate-binding protein [Streptomyces sp. BHT-5-2]
MTRSRPLARSRSALTACALAASALAAVTALAFAAPAATAQPPVPRPAPPSPTAPHTGVVAEARTPARTPGRERAARTFREGRRATSGQAWTHHPRLPASPTGAADVTHNWWGVFPQPGTHDGIMATHTVDPSYTVTDADNVTYAPTTKAQNSCMEVVTAYTSTGNEIWAWDWCGTVGPAKTVPIDSDFLKTYTPGQGQPAAYSVQMVRDDATANRWSAYLYNYRTAAWDLLFRQSGTDQSGLDHGWDMFEIYASVNPATSEGYYCTEARNTVFDSSAVQLRAGGSWKPASPADSPWTETDPDPNAFLCPPLKFVQVSADDHWTVHQ